MACSPVAQAQDGRLLFSLHRDSVLFSHHHCQHVKPVLWHNTKVTAYVSDCQHKSDVQKVSIPAGPSKNDFTSGITLWDEIISAHSSAGDHAQVINLYEWMHQNYLEPNRFIIISVLRACLHTRNLRKGRLIHAHTIELGLGNDLFICSMLISMYSSCQSLQDAVSAFHCSPKPDPVMWSALVINFIRNDKQKQALEMFQEMVEQGIDVDKTTCIWCIKACSSLSAVEHGKWVHSYIVQSGFESDASVSTAVFDMYAKCGDMVLALSLFSRMQTRTVITWTAFITICTFHGWGQDIHTLYGMMKLDSVLPNQVTFVCLLKASYSMVDVDEIHLEAIMSGFELNLSVGSTLIDTYSKHGCLDNAWILFNRLPDKDVVCWTSLINGYIQSGYGQEAIWLFEQMQEEGAEPNVATVISILKACSSLLDLENGKHFHCSIVEHGLDLEPLVGNSLMDMYLRCRSLDNALALFHSMPNKDRVSWNIMIAGYTQNGYAAEGLQLFNSMQCTGLLPDTTTVVHGLQACSAIQDRTQGMLLHSQIIETGCEIGFHVLNALIDMYAKCHELADACFLFESSIDRDVVTWNSLMSGYVHCGNEQDVYKLYKRMQGDAVDPNRTTFLCVLKACGALGSLEEGMQIHCQIIANGFQNNLFVTNTLIKMYFSCKRWQEPQILFASISQKNVTVWNTLIGGCVQLSLAYEALKIFQLMCQWGFEPNDGTFVCVLQACAGISVLELGKEFHYKIVERGFEYRINVANALIDMYVKCGSLAHALQVFGTLEEWSVVSWSALIRGYAHQSDYTSAVRCFEDMQQMGIKPDSVAYLCLLSACSHTNLVEKGCFHFRRLREGTDIPLTVEHYNCMVDLFSHSGLADEAEDLLETIPFACDTLGWVSLLGSCTYLKNAHLGKRCFDQIIANDSCNAAAYVLMEHLYMHLGRQDDAQRIEVMRRQANVWKKPGKAFIELEKQIHVFTVDDKCHPLHKDINAKMEDLSLKLSNEEDTSRMDLVLKSAFG